MLRSFAQTGQFFDVLHQPGNVHGSNGAEPKEHLKNTVLESRMDSAFISKEIMSILNSNHVKFTASVPFERLTEFKAMVEKRKRWHKIDKQWSYFVTQWKPKSWDDSYRFVFTMKKNKNNEKARFSITFLNRVISITITRSLSQIK